MHEQIKENRQITAKALAISSLTIFLLFAWQGNIGFNLWDEGYLWYGVQRVLLGEVPIRDFMAYDPGRYYWSAAILEIAGNNSIMSVRVAAAIFQALGLFAALFLAAQSFRGRNEKSIVIFLIISAAILATWMFPRHKLFDISLSIFLIFTLTFLIKNPTPKRYFIAGACVGLVAVFGRNHGMYGVAGSLGVIFWLNIKRKTEPRLLSSLTIWALGVSAGFLPIIGMILILPGFATSFLESILLIFEQGSTNLPLPVPWPWTVNFSSSTFIDASRGLLTGIFFIAAPIFGVGSILWVVTQRLKEKPIQPALVSAAFLTIPYTHYAFSRADTGHLAQGIFPLLMGCLVIISTIESRVKWLLASTLCAASLWVTHPFHPGWYCMTSKQCVSVEVSGSTLKTDPDTASDIALLRNLADKYAPNGQSFISAPFWPGAYALLERKSPMWEIYPLFPRSENFERGEIERIKSANPSFALIIETALDGRDELRFKSTHPLIYRYITENFDPLPTLSTPPYIIYKSRSTGQ